MAAPPPRRETDEDEKANTLLNDLLLGAGIDRSKINKPLPVPDEVARALAPSRPRDGDNWTYARVIRDDAPIIRRNYVTLTAAFVNDHGYAATHSDANTPSRYDGAGNRVSSPAVAPHRHANVVFDPVDVLFRFPLTPGASWSGSVREVSSTTSVDARTEVKVVGWEDIEVPAGKFRALKLAQVQNRRWEPFPGSGEQSRRVTNVWYVPGVRNLARMETLEVTSRGVVVTDQTWELEQFELN
jgi:hypothetical protein